MIRFAKRGRVAAALSSLVLSLATLNNSAQAAGSVVHISSNSGGRIGEFMARVDQYRTERVLVKFDGYCDSACTLLLALPKSSSCVNTGAVFRFHAPMAASAGTSLAAKHFLMAQYPGWVRNWIASNHGLTSTLISMDYRYASRFMRTCNELASR